MFRKIKRSHKVINRLESNIKNASWARAAGLATWRHLAPHYGAWRRALAVGANHGIVTPIDADTVFQSDWNSSQFVYKNPPAQSILLIILANK